MSSDRCHICLKSEDRGGWSMLNHCKHQFHTVCIEFFHDHRVRCNFNPRCPKCNVHFFFDEIKDIKL